VTVARFGNSNTLLFPEKHTFASLLLDTHSLQNAAPHAASGIID